MLLDSCSAYCTEWDIKLNARKNKKHVLRKRSITLTSSLTRRLKIGVGAKLRLPLRHSTQRRSIWPLRQRQTAEILPIAECHHSNRGALRRHGHRRILRTLIA